MNPIRTIGHSNHPIERFVELLRAGGVNVLVDVRSTPWSRRFPQFGKDRLAKTLAEAGIAYLHEGAALGGKPEAGGSYDDLAARPDFAEALDRVTARASAKLGRAVLCLMCAEKAPLDCHRTVLVSRRLAERDVAIEDGYILARCLERHRDDLGAALLRYEAARRERTRGTVLGSAQNAARFHNPRLADETGAQEYIDREWREARIRDRYEWLFTYDATAAAI